MLLLVGERKILKALREAKATEKEVIPFRKGDFIGELTIEPYKNVIGVSVGIKHKSSLDVREDSYTDIPNSRVLSQNVYNIQKAVDKLYRLCGIGLYVQYGIWENTLPKETHIDDIIEYFGIREEDIREAEVESYKYAKKKIRVKGLYYGEKIITIIQSKKTGFVSNILGIEEIV